MTESRALPESNGQATFSHDPAEGVAFGSVRFDCADATSQQIRLARRIPTGNDVICYPTFTNDLTLVRVLSKLRLVVTVPVRCSAVSYKELRGGGVLPKTSAKILGLA